MYSEYEHVEIGTSSSHELAILFSNITCSQKQNKVGNVGIYT